LALKIENLSVAINGSLMHTRPTGLSRYGEELSSCLLKVLPKAKIYTQLNETLELFPQQAIQSGPIFHHPANFTSNLKRLLWLQSAMRCNLYLHKPLVSFAPIAEGITNCPVPQVLTIHDFLPLHDPNFMPRWKIYYERILPKILKKDCKKIICVSDFTKRELIKYYADIDENRIKVIHPGFNQSKFEKNEEISPYEKFGIDDYFLLVGEGRPYKNLEIVPKALSIYQGKSLVAICGRIPKDEQKRIQEIANAAGVGGRLKWLGYVSDQDLGVLYQRSKAFLFPSLYEGFGLPLLEAMAFGTPILCSNAASLPEAGGNVPIYFDPSDPVDLSHKMHYLDQNQNLVEQLRAAGYQRVKAFSWKKSAAKHINAFLEILR
jgi:glycosyltransferase involved in cell wall biosynthesis